MPRPVDAAGQRPAAAARHELAVVVVAIAATTTAGSGSTRRRRVPAARLAALAAALILLAAGCAGRAGGRDLAPGTGVVVGHVDGDTVEVEVAGGRVETVRLLGIDTPESVAPDRPVECHGPEASAATAELLPVGTVVRLERDVEARDRFGRLLAHVFRDADGLHVNEALAAGGHAETLVVEPNVAYADRLAAAVAEARRAGAGMWGHCPAPPR